MENLFLLRTEIVIFFISFLYIIYYLYEKIVMIFVGLKNIIKPDKTHIKEKINQLKEIEKKSVKEKTLVKEKVVKNKIAKKISAKDSKKIAEILKRVKLNNAKGLYKKAKSLLIEGLAIDKLNKDLNLELVKIYEEEKNYVKAEFIYNDLLGEYNNNFEILKKLGYNLAIQKKYKESIDIYLKAYNKRKDDIDIIEFLADLTYQIKYFKKSLKFTKLFLRQHPRNSEKLKMKAFCQETLGEIEDAIGTYKKVIELQPYNVKVQEKIAFLEQNL